MALATYADLQASIASWLARDDLTACIPDFIALCEADLNRRLRIRAMETAVDIAVPAVPGGDSAPVPAGFKGARRLFIQADPPADLDYVTPDLLYSRPAGAVPGRPRLFTIEGDSFVFRPVPDAAYTGKLLYWQA